MCVLTHRGCDVSRCQKSEDIQNLYTFNVVHFLDLHRPSSYSSPIRLPRPIRFCSPIDTYLIGGYVLEHWIATSRNVISLGFLRYMNCTIILGLGQVLCFRSIYSLHTIFVSSLSPPFTISSLFEFVLLSKCYLSMSCSPVLSVQYIYYKPSVTQIEARLSNHLSTLMSL